MDRGGGYRGLREVILRRRAAFERRAVFLERELAPLFAKRKRRAVFGVTATLLGLSSFVAAGAGVLLSLDHRDATEATVIALLSALPLGMALAFGTTFVLRKRISPPPPRLPELRERDEQSLFDLDVAEAELEAYPRHQEANIGWTLVGLGWTLPLTLHYIIALCMGSTREFGAWVALSILISLQSHIALAVLNGRFARLLTTSEEPVSIHMQWLRTLGITTLVASVPWVFLAAIPTIITAVTGFAFIPAMYLVVAKRFQTERARTALIVAASYAELAYDEEAARMEVFGGTATEDFLRVGGALAAAGAEEEDADSCRENHREARHVPS